MWLLINNRKPITLLTVDEKFMSDYNKVSFSSTLRCGKDAVTNHLECISYFTRHTSQSSQKYEPQLTKVKHIHIYRKVRATQEIKLIFVSK